MRTEFRATRFIVATRKRYVTPALRDALLSSIDYNIHVYRTRRRARYETPCIYSIYTQKLKSSNRMHEYRKIT